MKELIVAAENLLRTLELEDIEIPETKALRKACAAGRVQLAKPFEFVQKTLIPLEMVLESMESVGVGDERVVMVAANLAGVPRG